MLGLLPSSLALAVQPQLATGLTVHLHAKLAVGLAGSSAPDVEAAADSLVQQLAALAPPSENANEWCRREGLRVARILERRPDLADSLAEGSATVAQALRQIDEEREAASELFETIAGHHARLRDEVSVDWDADDVSAMWRGVTAEQAALLPYAEAASQIGTREWAKAGIAWCAEQATHFYRGGGARKLAMREAATAPTTDDVAVAAAAADVAVPSGEGGAIRLLDVGACGNLFADVEGIEATALDLCPRAETTLQCDFLRLEVDADPASERVVEPHADVPAGSLVRLPAGAADAVVMSLVLSYLPQPRQRAAMVAQARRVLQSASPTRRGLLLIVDTMAVDRKARTWREQTNLHRWVDAIEQLGFVFLRHQTLCRTHALAFATAPLSDEELAERLSAPLPELALIRGTGYTLDGGSE